MKKLLLAVFSLSLFAISLQASIPSPDDDSPTIPTLISVAGR